MVEIIQYPKKEAITTLENCLQILSDRLSEQSYNLLKEKGISAIERAVQLSDEYQEDIASFDPSIFEQEIQNATNQEVSTIIRKHIKMSQDSLAFPDPFQEYLEFIQAVVTGDSELILPFLRKYKIGTLTIDDNTITV